VNRDTTNKLRAPDDQSGAGSTGAVPAAAAQANTQATAQPTQTVVPQREPKNLIIPTDQMKKVKEEARLKGQREGLERLVKELGMSSVNELKERLKPVQPKQPTQKIAPKQKQDNQAARNPNDRRLSQLERERDEIAKRMAREAFTSKRLKRQLAAFEARTAIEKAAIAAGVRDVDVAVELLRKEAQGLTSEECVKFDEAKFFTDLRTTKPYLFGEYVTPANTGTGSNTPAPQGASAALQNQVTSGIYNAANKTKVENKMRLAQILAAAPR
jgi:hypothetical protein